MHQLAPTTASLQRTAWMTVGLLWPVALLNYLDRMMLSTMKLSIEKDITVLHSAEKFGQLMAVFMWVYAFCSPLGGLIADRLSRKWLIVVSLCVWSAVTLLMGHANDFEHLYWLRAIMGVSEAFYIPAGLALIADFHRGATRSMAIGVHMSGIYLGQALGGVGGWVAQEISWRTAFTSCGYIGVAYAFVLMVLLREAPSTEQSGPPEKGVSKANWIVTGVIGIVLGFTLLPGLRGWLALLPKLLQNDVLMAKICLSYLVVLITLMRIGERKPKSSASPDEPSMGDSKVSWLGFILLIFCFALPSLPGWAVKNWLPTLLQDRFQMDQASSGLWATIAAASAGFFGVLIGGIISDLFINRHVRSRTWISATGLFLLIPALIGMGMAPAFWMVIVCTALYGLGFGLFDTNNMPILCQVMPARLRATGYGLLNYVGIGSGAYLTPLLGKLKDHGVPLSQGFAVCAAPALIAMILMLLLRPASRDRI